VQPLYILGEIKQKLNYPGTGMAAVKSIWERLEYAGIRTNGRRLYPFHACYDFEARISSEPEIAFDKLPQPPHELPVPGPIEPPQPTPNYDTIRTRYEENGKFTICDTDIDMLDKYCYSIAQQQPCLFDIKVAVWWRNLETDDANKLRRMTIIEPVGLISGIEAYRERFPAGFIESKLAEFGLLDWDRVNIRAIDFNVCRKRTFYPGELTPIRFAINSNVAGHDEPFYAVCPDDDEDSIHILLQNFVEKLNEISDSESEILKLEHQAAFEELRYS